VLANARFTRSFLRVC